MSSIYLGYPSARVVEWIKAHSQPSELGIPIYFEGQEANATVALIALDKFAYEPKEHLYCNLECSTDGMSTWSAYDGEIISLDSCTGKRVYFRAPEGQPNTNGFYDEENNIYHCFKLEKAVKAGGNIQFLLESTGTRTDVPAYAFYQMFGTGTWDDERGESIYWCETLTQAPALPATTLADSCYYNMFNRCASLTQAPALPATALADNCYHGMFDYCASLTQAPALPATTLSYGCYNSMFSNCTSLTQTPALPATTLADHCYHEMFIDCTSLTQAPALPAMTLARYCYSGMFKNCTSLTQAPELPATTLADRCYHNMFYHCTSLTQAPELPATTLADYCYTVMFSNCTSLTQAPELPATKLASYCYSGMFNGCTSLTQAPELPATTLADYCYNVMFSNCASLTQAPELPAPTLVNRCYYNMFKNCTSLTSMNVSFTAWNPASATTNWMANAGSQATETKTFTCPAALPNTTGDNNIPSGWTRVEK